MSLDLKADLISQLQSFFGHDEISDQQRQLAEAIATAVESYVKAYVKLYVLPDDLALASLGKPVTH